MQTYKNTRRYSFSRGFNLVEAAIVLGVVGLIIGGIWVAASSVAERRQNTELASAMLTIVQDLRRTMTGQTYPTSWLWMNELVIKGGMLPANWTGNTSWVITAPQGSGINIGADYDATELAATNGHGLSITFLGNLSNAQCINLVAAVTSRFRDRSNLSHVAIGSATFLRSFPADMATINTDCLARGGNPSVTFVFTP